MEENVRPRLNPERPETERLRALRGFGIGLGALLLWAAWRGRGAERGVPLAVLAAASWAAAGLRPALLRRPYDLWMPVVGVLAKVNLWVVCGVLYYGVVTPYGLLLRALGFRPLELALREKDSYWIEKPPRDAAESARRIF